MDRTFGTYLAFFGFILVIVGICVAWASIGSTQQYSFDSPSSALSNGVVTLLLGGLVAVFGAGLLIFGLLSATRRPRYPYYY